MTGDSLRCYNFGMDLKDNGQYTKADARNIIHPKLVPALNSGLIFGVSAICKACLNYTFSEPLCNVGIRVDGIGQKFDRVGQEVKLVDICKKFSAAVNSYPPANY